MTNEIARYHLNGGLSGGTLHPEGDWCQYRDVAAEIERLQSENAELKRWQLEARKLMSAPARELHQNLYSTHEPGVCGGK